MVPHTVNSNGYCTVCKMYIGTDEEAGTATIDGVEYDAAFSSDVNAAAGNWNKVSLGDSSFATALSTEGAMLVITRDSESTISYVSGEAYEKFMIGKDDSNHVDLATVGTTTEDEEGLVAFTSDDGTTAIYDGATVYAALEAAGMADLDSYVLISNTSGSYTITNVSVYVPAGTIVSEDVGVDEPAEEGETETEEDGEDLTVEDETPAAEETNPTTGVALALVPMAIAGFAVVSSKRR
ncbi:MAG: hypothetical protein LUG86_04065 [Oscillospiraceae bacterium]|nr:hypothetical protein [Oscillospiraceae bacterium]